ncbi:MAG TPA: serine/threonine-protein kinase [Polyangiaceae bacterium]|nr:serine/threonine-protein kinase [Polyangiaceae bacterium]
MPRPLAGAPVKFGPFWLDARLAVGGTAEVYLARPIPPSALPARLVVKRLLPQFVEDPEGRTMFEREAALHAAVHHENVVKVHEYGSVGDEPWLAMELVDGCDLFRLLRRLSSDGRGLTAGLATHITRELLSALESVHSASDANGQPMGIIHRDVTPSNVYLSNDGRVKLGDFGIARAMSRPTLRSAQSDMLKGKFAYLAPEQVAGEPFDHRADLFAMAAVTSEMLLGQPLFAGSGQLAVLLAIRDCRIDALRTVRATLPKGLFAVLERALARDPAARFFSARELSQALAPFDVPVAAARAELGALVRSVQATPSVEQMQAVRDSARKLRAATPMRSFGRVAGGGESDRTTGEYAAIPSYVVKGSGDRLGPWPFARLVEAIATGEVGRGDMVDYMGRGLQPIEAIDEVARFLPPKTATTNRVAGVDSPDFVDEVSPATLVTVLLRVVESAATGVLFAEGPSESRRLHRKDTAPGRKELYFVGGKLHHVASNNASELFGEYLVRRKMISREELDFALAVLPRYGGRMGDTLIALGLVGSLDIFRAIRDQGRARLVDLFQWNTGKLTFYTAQTPPHVEFPLDLDLPPLILAGAETASPGDTPLRAWRDRLDAIVVRASAAPTRLLTAAWPPSAKRLIDAVEEPTSVRALLTTTAHDLHGDANAVLRALEVLVAARLLSVT